MKPLILLCLLCLSLAGCTSNSSDSTNPANSTSSAGQEETTEEQPPDPQEPNDSPDHPLPICSASQTQDSILPGMGTNEDPFILCFPSHLALIGHTSANEKYTLSATYVMGKDIDLNNDDSFNPIRGVFTGTFNGRGKKITNLRIHQDGNAALFLELGSGGNIQNLGIENFNVVGSRRVGSLVAVNSGTIANCYALDSDDSIDVSGTNHGDNIGGLVGLQHNHGSIISSYAAGQVDGGKGYDSVGGLVGAQDNGHIVSSYATGQVHGGEGNDDTGGLVGASETNSYIISSYATGQINGGKNIDNVGGLVGDLDTRSHIISSYATGRVNGGMGEDSIGGLAGLQDNNSHIISSYATGQVNGGKNHDTVGGLVGDLDIKSHIISSYATGQVNGGMGEDSIGGLAGLQDNNSHIISSYATGQVNGGVGDNAIGVLVGTHNNSRITSSYGFGVTDKTSTNTYGSPPNNVTSASDLTHTNSSDSDANRWSVHTWDFGTSSQTPALKYVDNYGDHDNDNETPNIYTCTSTTAFLPPITINCGITLLPNQPNRPKGKNSLHFHPKNHSW